MRIYHQMAHKGYARKINMSRGNLVIVLFASLMLGFFLSTCTIPYLISADNSISLVLELEDKGDGEENDSEEIFIADKAAGLGLKMVSARLHDYSGLMVKHQLPLPSIPYLETICPPPDWV